VNRFWELFSAAHPLVHIDAALNSLATLLLVIGYVLIKRGNIEGHKRAMFAALATSAVFLACYLTYHLALGRETKFPLSGVVRTFYLALLASHVILAMTVPFLAIATIIQGMRSQASWLPGHVRAATEAERAEYVAKCRRRHVGLAKVAFPIWMYVSITGVLVYVMLYYVGPSLVAA
jgi:uncharacterized membrane protein YozB (DUF420 family)